MSESGYIRDEKYQFLLKHFPANKISIRYKYLWADIVEIIKKLKLEDKVRIDENSFQMVIIDYFTDIDRLKDFQDINRINLAKIYGYELYWFLRRHPIHLVENISNGFDINERVAIGIFLPKLLKEAGLEYSANMQNTNYQIKVKEFAELLLYNLKYRIYTQQSLELMMEAFLCGVACHQSVTPSNP